MDYEFADMGWPGFIIILVGVFLLGCWFCNWRSKRKAKNETDPMPAAVEPEADSTLSPEVAEVVEDTKDKVAQVLDSPEPAEAEVTDEADADPTPAAAIDEDALVAKVVEAMMAKMPENKVMSEADIEAIVTKVTEQMTFDNIAEATKAQRDAVAKAAEEEAARRTAERESADADVAAAQAKLDKATSKAAKKAAEEGEATSEAEALRARADQPVCGH